MSTMHVQACPAVVFSSAECFCCVNGGILLPCFPSIVFPSGPILGVGFRVPHFAFLVLHM